MSTKIEWTDATWNPITGCTKISEACQHCYAERMAKRLAGRFGYPKDEPFKVTYHPDRLIEPSIWQKPRKVFVCSMADLFHDSVTTTQQVDIFWAMRNAERHTYQVLTKRPHHMHAFFAFAEAQEIPFRGLNHVWLGVTAENQQRADERIPILLDTPAAVRFVSVEPMLSAVDLSKYLSCEFYAGPIIEPRAGTIGGTAMPAARLRPRLDWIIVGAETGPGARPCKDEWVKALIDQCRAAQMPVFVKGKLAERFPLQEYPQ